ncbi:MAG: GNAT family N-acetyltransferase [bacterium]
MIVLAFSDNKIVGATTGIPLSRWDYDDITQNIFKNAGYDVSKIFCFGESVVLKEFRGKGLGKDFFKIRENYSQKLGDFNITTFCAVERPVDHHRKPADHLLLDRFWNKMGYIKHPELRSEFVWQDLDEKEESPKPMVFWLKRWGQ